MKVLLFFIVCIFNMCCGHHPNIVILLADDMGIGDVGSFGNHSIKTPHIDRLASEGMKLTHHLTAATVCSPSRAALLTGRYPARFGFVGGETGPPVIIHVASGAALPKSEVTLAEALQAANYTTGAVGKWHLGSECGIFGLHCPGPLNYGFSFAYGLPFSLIAQMGRRGHFWIFDIQNSIYQIWLALLVITTISMSFCFLRKLWCLAILLLIIILILFPTIWFCYTHLRLHTTRWYHGSDWLYKNLDGVTIKNGVVVRQTLDFQGNLSQEMIEQSVKFIEEAVTKDNPFFLYHSFLHVHTPMFTAKENKYKSVHGMYGDNVEELDEGVGTILKALDDNNIADNTIVYFLSDHGGHVENIDPVTKQRVGGHNKEYKGGKATGGQEGGIRIPGIIRWNDHIPADTSLDVPTSTMDTLPTLLQLAELPPVHELVPLANELDGVSYRDRLLHPELKTNSKRVLLHHCRRSIHAMRLVTADKVYKMHLAWPNWKENSTQCGWGDVYCKCYGEGIVDYTENPLLFELLSDPYEDNPIEESSPQYNLVVSELRSFLNLWRQKVTYPPSMFADWRNSIWLPWRQPFCHGC